MVYSDASRLNCTIATYVCSTEFNPTNGLTRKCIPVNGTADWSDPEPACERKDGITFLLLIILIITNKYTRTLPCDSTW